MRSDNAPRVGEAERREATRLLLKHGSQEVRINGGAEILAASEANRGFCWLAVVELE